MQLDLPLGPDGTVPTVRTPIRMSATPPVYRRAAPRLGEHSDAILAELGYSDADIDRFRRARVVAGG
jgi:crotonobetainyl-CoA:carnitine CoA-transferase CaiB-like acyl-CoA transferase